MYKVETVILLVETIIQYFYYLTGPLKQRKQYLEYPCIEIPRSTRHYEEEKNVLSDKRLVCNNENPVKKTQGGNKHVKVC